MPMKTPKGSRTKQEKSQIALFLRKQKRDALKALISTQESINLAPHEWGLQEQHRYWVDALKCIKWLLAANEKLKRKLTNADLSAAPTGPRRSRASRESHTG